MPLRINSHRSEKKFSLRWEKILIGMRINTHAYENNVSYLRETFGIVITKKSLPFVYTKEETLYPFNV